MQKRELNRLRQAARKASSNLLTELYGKLSEEDYNKVKGYHDWALSTINIYFSLMANRFKELYQKKKVDTLIHSSRSFYDVFTSGIRKVLKLYPHSYWSSYVIKLFKLEEFQERVKEWNTLYIEYLRYYGSLQQDIEKYLNFIDRGVEIASSYTTLNKKELYDDTLVKFYAIWKTWEDEEYLNKFVEDLAKMLDITLELFVEGPVRLYLKISPENYIIIFKTLTAESLKDLNDKEDKELQEIMEFHRYIYKTIKEENQPETGFFYITSRYLKETAKQFVENLKEEIKKLTLLFPTRELREKFIMRFEEGYLFRESNPWIYN